MHARGRVITRQARAISSLVSKESVKMSSVTMHGPAGDTTHTNGTASMETENGSPAKKQRLMVADDSSDKPILHFAKLTENAYAPTRGSKLAAGFDLYRYLYLYFYRTMGPTRVQVVELFSHIFVYR